MPVSNVIGEKIGDQCQIYFDSLGKVYKKVGEGTPQFISKGYLLALEGEDVYFYRNINVGTTKVYKVSKNGLEKEIATLEGRSSLIRRTDHVVAFVSFLEDQAEKINYDLVIVNLKGSKSTIISQDSKKLAYDIPFFYKDGDVAIVYYTDGETEMIDTRNGNKIILSNFEKYVFPDSHREFGFNFLKNYPIDFNKILQIKKGKGKVEILLVDAHNNILKALATASMR
ncbi:hypothetical protein [Thermoanaerobacter wiegelii]|uniref:hypothetical protein n=1 Tax=Thermoanaerobacter wiegelii TaxID=46354 RepID=UPI0001E4F865|nr:hypothetical protein [Thermoanaerobacter wiegelii]